MDKDPRRSANRFIDEMLGYGRYTFSRTEAARWLKVSPAAVYLSLARQVRSGRLAMPCSGFYVIVDAQHRVAGILPPEWFIHPLMDFLERPYYVGLLSAAQLHGAAHQQPQLFQVMIPDRRVRPIRAGNVHIQFHGKGSFHKAMTVPVKTPTGNMLVSTAETTVWDLVRYPRSAGGLDNVMTVIKELIPQLDAVTLLKTLKAHEDILVAQRLGYLLDELKTPRLTKGIAGWIGEAPLRPLDPSTPPGRAVESKKWRLLINVKLESEA